MPIERSAAWKALSACARSVGRTRSGVGKSATHADLDGLITLDFSNQYVNPVVLRGLLGLARARGLKGQIAAMMAGAAVNFTEQLPALHPALRGTRMARLPFSLHKKIRADRDRFLNFAGQVRTGSITGAGKRRFTDVINVGMGGSESGACLLARALEEASDTPVRVHFVGDADGGGLCSLLPGLNAETALFIIASKSFATTETLADAAVARAWIESRLGRAAFPKHFAAVSAQPRRMREWGIAAARQFRIREGTGGRFSLWSAMGLAAAVRIGSCAFQALLDGAHRADVHFKSAPYARNLPVLLALLDLWNFNFNGIQSKAILPYDFRLRNLVPYLMQLEMESLGKTIGSDGRKIGVRACVPVWGDLGWRARHSFFQMLLQGGERAAVDLVLVKSAGNARGGGAAARAHSRLFACGRRGDHPHERIPGAVPHGILTAEQLTPVHLGALIAVFEHKIFAQAALCDVNPFDQPGVESLK